MTGIPDQEITIRAGSFLVGFIFMWVWELRAPRRQHSTPKRNRWTSNISMVLFNSFSLRLIFPILAVDVAILAQGRGWGLLNQAEPPHWLAVAAGLIFLDLAIYLQHVMFHAVPALWRLHMMHHSDLDFDVTTGLRFHPIEIYLSMIIKMSMVLILGPPAFSVILFEVLLNATSMFNHGNVRLPHGLDKILRLLVVTPEMHRVHHSVIRYETNSNFGFNLPWWDRLFGTYKQAPSAGHEGMTIGLGHLRDPDKLHFPHLLVLPFMGKPGVYPINAGGRYAGKGNVPNVRS